MSKFARESAPHGGLFSRRPTENPANDSSSPREPAENFSVNESEVRGFIREHNLAFETVSTNEFKKFVAELFETEIPTAAQVEYVANLTAAFIKAERGIDRAGQFTS